MRITWVILEHMPVTAVGKIFKLPLRCDAVRRVYTSILSTVLSSDVLLDVQTEAHQQHSMVAILILANVPKEQRTQVQEQIARALGVYVVRYQIQWR